MSMICVHYRDRRERAQALLSISLHCEKIGARLVFIGPETACAHVREDVRQLEPTALPGLGFRPLDASADRCPEGSTFAAALRTVLLELSAVETFLVGWVEAPAPTAGNGYEMWRNHHDSLRAMAGTTAALIDGVCLERIPAAALPGLLEAAGFVVSAKTVTPRCPAWLIRRGDDLETQTTADAQPGSLAEAACGAAALQVEPLVSLRYMAAGVAHELGNPLSIISSSLQYLHQRLSAANDPASEFTLTALENVDRMHRLLRSILEFTTIQRTRSVKIDINEAVSEVMRFTSTECARRGIRVEVSFDPSLPPQIWGDTGGIKQVFLNLVKNAFEAGGDRLVVRTRAVAGSAVVELENNGPPITPAVLQQLFQPFHTTKTSGTGLGLYLSRQIARDHGGELACENLRDGVRFALTLSVTGPEGGGDGAHPDRG